SSLVLLRWIVRDCRGTGPTGTAVGIRLETSAPDRCHGYSPGSHESPPLTRRGHVMRTPDGMSHIRCRTLPEHVLLTSSDVRRVSPRPHALPRASGTASGAGAHQPCTARTASATRSYCC